MVHHKQLMQRENIWLISVKVQKVQKLKDPRGVEKDLVIKQTENKMSEKDYDNLENIM